LQEAPSYVNLWVRIPPSAPTRFANDEPPSALNISYLECD
jgi:hypothetical protein